MPFTKTKKNSVQAQFGYQRPALNPNMDTTRLQIQGRAQHMTSPNRVFMQAWTCSHRQWHELCSAQVASLHKYATTTKHLQQPWDTNSKSWHSTQKHLLPWHNIWAVIFGIYHIKFWHIPNLREWQQASIFSLFEIFMISF